jgi:hypothetical protein
LPSYSSNASYAQCHFSMSVAILLLQYLTMRISRIYGFGGTQSDIGSLEAFF